MVSDAVVLFFIIDPFGLVPVVSVILGRLPERRRRPVLVRELLIALVALVLFLFAGRHLLALMHISQPALTMAGGLILLLIALPMVFPSIRLSMTTEDEGEPFIVPLAVPMFAGPSALAMVILMGTRAEQEHWPHWLGSIAIAWAGASAVLLSGDWLVARLGRRFVTALERLVGMLLVAIAVEMFLSGVLAARALAPPGAG